MGGDAGGGPGGKEYLNSKFSPRWLRRGVVESGRRPSRRTRGPPLPAGSAPPAPPPSSSPGGKYTVTSSVADLDPGSGALLTPGSGIWEPGWVKNEDPDPGSGSGMNNPDHNSVSFETIFLVKILKFFDAESGIQDGRNTDPG
jgi:hypothetical protein